MPKLYLAVLLAFSSLGFSAHADKIFALSNATLYFDGALYPHSTYEGTLTGTFTTNDALNAILTYDITASPSIDPGIAGFHYTPASSRVDSSNLPSQYFSLYDPVSSNQLLLSFQNGLTVYGAVIDPIYSGENERKGRTVYGLVVPVSLTPEPSSFVLLGTGLLGIAGASKRRLV